MASIKEALELLGEHDPPIIIPEDVDESNFVTALCIAVANARASERPRREREKREELKHRENVKLSLNLGTNDRSLSVKPTKELPAYSEPTIDKEGRLVLEVPESDYAAGRYDRTAVEYSEQDAELNAQWFMHDTGGGAMPTQPRPRPLARLAIVKERREPTPDECASAADALLSHTGPLR